MNLYKTGINRHSFLIQAFLLFFGLGFSLLASADIHEGGDATKGEQLFKANCASCHRATAEALAAPGLAGIKDRWKGKDELLIQWIQNPNAAIATGDAYVRSMVEKYQANYGLMQAQAVSAEDINHILTYVANYKDDTTPKEGTGSTDTWYIWDENEGKVDSDPTIWFLILALLFLVIALSASGVRRSLHSAVLESQGKEPLPQLSYSERLKAWAWDNKVFVSIIGLFLFSYVVVLLYGMAMDVGIYQGYRPEQPIKFSHKLHAGKNKIDCQYCHSSASKSKHAGIPSVNVCMNCHKGIKQGHNDEFTAEIQKIYDAIGFDPETGSYKANYEQKPIEWVKVHNLPDHAYFNHAQHVAVGGLQCQNCHGPVETYTVGRISPVDVNNKVDMPGIIQLSKPTLTMGWCIECHNKAEVKLEGNGGYYDEILHRLETTERGNEELRHYLEDEVITVKELGGWECAKCHY